MVRGDARSPSLHAYRGALGRTQTALVHVAGPSGDLVPATVHVSVDAVADPELAGRLLDEAPGRGLNVVGEGAAAQALAVPVVYHDPAELVLVLVLDERLRHRELDERIRLLERLRGDDAPVPAYAKEFGVAFGAAGLRAWLARHADRARDARQAAALAEELARARAADQARQADAARGAAERAAAQEDLRAARADLDAARGELAAARDELARRDREAERRSVEEGVARQELAARMVDLERTRTELERLRVEARQRIADAEARADALRGAGASERADATQITAPPSARERVVTTPMPLAASSAAHPAAGQGHTVVAPSVAARLAAAMATTDDAAAAGEGDPLAALDLGDDTRAAPPSASASDATAAAARVPADEPGDEEDDDGDEVTGEASIDALLPPGSDPLTTETTDLPARGGVDPWLERAVATAGASFGIEQGQVRVGLVASEQLARGLTGALDVRLLLHRTPTYPVVALVIGPPAALRGPRPTELAVGLLDVGADHDRQVLQALARRFELTLDVVVGGAPARRARVVAPLAENTAYILRAAEDYLRGLAAEGGEAPSASAARAHVTAAGYDLLGVAHPEAGEFRDDKLAQVSSANQLRRAIAMARRFARPSREDYLVCVRGFPLPRWRQLRRHVLEQAVTWGLWMGPELAQVAVSEGLARSRRDLVVRLESGFEALRRHPSAMDLDDEAAADNAKALAEEARALGVEPPRRARPEAIASSVEPEVSGMIIDRKSSPAVAARGRSVDELLAALDDRAARVAAALELCERGEARAAGPVIEAATRLSRAEAVRVLGMCVRFGAAAAPHLEQQLGSSKAFVRHGAALALAMLRTEAGTQAVIELLLREPTEIWREVARALGQVGPAALLPLASNLGRLGERSTPAIQERVAWAMAHVGVRGGRAAIEAMAAGHSVMAPVARKSLELLASAARDQVAVRPAGEGTGVGRDVTVNRAFSRRFFEALEHGLPEAAHAALEDLEVSSPMEMLDEADLIEDEELDVDELVEE